ncbi:hypothetical protein KKC91_06825, partial [bacterium]|nr:hypothetical protein [bacterium]
QEGDRKPYCYTYYWTQQGERKSEHRKAATVIKGNIMYLTFKIEFLKNEEKASGSLFIITETTKTVMKPFSFSIKCKKKKPEPVTVKKEEKENKQIMMSSKSLSILFKNAEEGFALDDIIKKDANLSLLHKGESRNMLWQISLKSDKGRGQGYSINNNTRAEKSYKIRKSGEEKTLFLYWKNIDIENESNVLDVTAQVDVKDDDDFAYWKISIKNRSKKYGLWRIDYPIINIAPIKKDPVNNYFVIPYGKNGYVIQDPFYTDKKRKVDVAVEGGRYGGSMRMGFIAYYHSSGDGLYFGLYDSGSYEKHIRQGIHRSKGYNELIFDHVPDNMGYAGEDYTMSYPIAVRAFNGDWYDVCQIYRRWALGQYWCQKGPLSERKDIPKWYLNSQGICRFTHTYSVIPEERFQDHFQKVTEFLGAPLTVAYYSWQKFNPYKSILSYSYYWPCSTVHGGSFSEPVEGFRKTVDTVHKAGGYVLPYINSLNYDQGADDASEAKPWVSQDIKGNRTVYSPTEPNWDMCRATKWWQERYASVCAWLAKEYDIDGIYMDSFGANQNRCFDTNHGHTHGAGNYNIMGQREFVKAVRSSLSKVKPESVLTIEHNGECYIDLVDASLTSHIISHNYAPLFHAVYNDYFMTMGSAFYYIACEDTPVDFAMEMGRVFVVGSKIGRFYIYHKDCYLINPRYKKQAEYTKLLVDYRKNLNEYFTYGKLLRPIKYAPGFSTVTSDKNPANPVTTPAVLSGVFQEPGGKVGMAFVNVSEGDAKINFNYDLSEYIKADKCSMFSVDRKGERKDLGIVKTAGFNYAKEVKVLDAYFLEFSAD